MESAGALTDDTRFRPSGVLDDTEKLRGIATSLISGGTAGALNFALTAAGLGPELSALIGLYVIGSLVGYSLDILFAKRNFPITSTSNAASSGSGSGSGKGKTKDNTTTTTTAMLPVAYTDFAVRGAWLLKSLVGKHFYRFAITVLLDTMIGIILLQAVVRAMDDRKFLVDFAYRDALAAGAIGVFTFFLYNNILRFDWAYSNIDDPVLNVTILMWTTLAMIVFAVNHNRLDTQGGVQRNMLNAWLRGGSGSVKGDGDVGSKDTDSGDAKTE